MSIVITVSICAWEMVGNTYYLLLVYQEQPDFLWSASYTITEKKNLPHMESVQEEILQCWEVVTIDLVRRTYVALCTDNSQEPPKVLTITILAEKKEADQIQMVQNNFGEERNPSWGQELNCIGTALWSANDLTLNFCLWSIMMPGSKPSQDILLVSSELYRCATVTIMFRAQ